MALASKIASGDSYENHLLGLLAEARAADYVGLEHMLSVWDIRRKYRARKPMNVLEILHDTRGPSVTVSLDKIYGSLGLVFDQRAFVSEPKYRLSAQERCLKMTASFITRTGSLDIVLLYQPAGTPCSPEHPPSWCPLYLTVNDIHDPKDLSRTVRYLDEHDSKLRNGNVCSFWDATYSSHVTKRVVNHRMGRLEVKGLRLGNIQARRYRNPLPKP